MTTKDDCLNVERLPPELVQSASGNAIRKARRPTSMIFNSAGRVSVNASLLWLTASIIPQAVSASWADRWLNGAPQAPLLSTYPSLDQQPQAPSRGLNQEHDFALRHIFDHGLYEHQAFHRRLDIKPEDPVWVTLEEQNERIRLGTFHARSTSTKIERLSDRRISTMQSLYYTARITGNAAVLDASEWTQDEVSAPNTTDKETVLSLAKMSWDAYTAEPGTGEWQDATGNFNNSQGFGWEGDSLRGHIFADKDNATVIIALKGTSPGRQISACSLSTYCIEYPPSCGLHRESTKLT